MGQSAQLTGKVVMIMYAVLTAASSMLIHDTNSQITPLLSAFYTFLFCLLFYNFFAKGMSNKRRQIRSEWINILLLNVTTAICWIFSFLSLKLVSPELFLYIYLCAMPITSSILFKTQLIRACIYFIGLILLSCTYEGGNLMTGFVLAFLGGASGTIYSIYSKKMTASFSAMEILSLRFYITVIVAGIYCYSFNYLQWLSVDMILKFGLLSFVSVIIPLTLFQLGIQYLSVTKALSYLPLAPLICYLFSIYVDYTSFNSIQLATVIFLSMTMFIKN